MRDYSGDLDKYFKYWLFVRDCNEHVSSMSDYAIVREFVRNISFLGEVSIERIAEAANTSAPSVSRLVRKLGFSSMHEFKSVIEVGRHLVAGEHLRRRQRRFGDLTHPNPAEIAARTADEAKSHIDRTITELDYEALTHAVNVLRNSTSVYILGESIEVSLFYSLQFTLLNDNVPAFSFRSDGPRDAHALCMDAGDTVLFLFTSAEWLQPWQESFLTTAHKAGSTIITIAQDDPGELPSDITLRYGVPGSNESAYYSLYLMCDVMASLYLRDPLRSE